MEPGVGPAAMSLLRQAGVEVADGLSEAEFDAVAARYGFRFGVDHYSLLAAGVPIGEAWVDWRGSPAALQERLEQPVNGVLAHVKDGFWWPAWGHRPNSTGEALRVARANLQRWPRLIPIYAHRYTPAAPSARGASVLSISGTDVIYYGADILHYLAREFALEYDAPEPSPRPVPPWTGLDNVEIVEVLDPPER